MIQGHMVMHVACFIVARFGINIDFYVRDKDLPADVSPKEYELFKILTYSHLVMASL